MTSTNEEAAATLNDYLTRVSKLPSPLAQCQYFRIESKP